MATTQFTFGVCGPFVGADLIPVMMHGGTSETETPSASNTVTSAAAPSDGTGLVCRVATDTDVYVSFGSSPDATSDTTRLYIPAGNVEYFGVQPSDKAAVATTS